MTMVARRLHVSMLALLMSVVMTGSIACRFKMPNVEEQRALIARRSLGDSNPEWLARPVVDPTAKHISFGLIPQSFGSPLAPNPMEASMADREREQRLARAREAKAQDKSKDEKKDSPLARIDTLCPGLEGDVNAALVTLEAEERAQRYKQLTERCPQSPDLWLWLAQDAFVIGEFDQARLAVTRTLALDPNNAEARALSEKIAFAQAPGKAPGKEAQ